MSDFTIGAWIVTSRPRHSREHDHIGTEPDTAVVLSDAIGPWAAGTALDVVLSAIEARLAELEITQFADRSFGSFSMDAVFFGEHFSIDAVTLREASSTLTIDAALGRGGSFGVDAVLQTGGRITLDALLV